MFKGELERAKALERPSCYPEAQPTWSTVACTLRVSVVVIVCRAILC